MSSLSSKIKYGIKWQAIFSLASQVLYFINGVILARILGPKEFGVYGMAQVVSSFVWMFWQLGLNAAIVQRKDINEKHLHTAFTISILMGCLCFLVTWIFAPFIATFFEEPQVAILVKLIAATFVIYAFDRVPSALLSRNLKFKEGAVSELINALLYPAVAIPMALSGFGAKSFVCGVLSGAVGMVLIRYYWLFKYFSWRPKLLIDKNSARELLSFGIYLTLTNILNFFLWNLQKIIVGKYLGAEDLGYYNRAANLSSLPLKKIYTTIGVVLLPTFARIQDDIEKTRDWFRKFNFMTYALITPPLMYFIFFPDLFIGAVFGPRWIESAWILRFTSFMGMLGISGFYWTNMLNAKGYSKILFYMNFIRLPVLGVSLFIGLQFGLKGIIVALIFNSIFTFFLFILILKKYIGVHINDYILSVWEPISINIATLLFITILMYWLKLVFPGYWIPFFITGILFSIFILAYYLHRYFIRSYVGYLNFDLRKLLSDV